MVLERMGAMKISVVYRDGSEQAVSKAHLQFLIATRQIMFFKRSEGWVVIGRDAMRNRRQSFEGMERRDYGVVKDYWY